MSSLENYYVDQAGNGLAAFAGVRYQRGHGFFGRLMSKYVVPILKMIGKNALKAGSNIASDLVDSDNFSMNNVKEVGKHRLAEQTKTMVKRAAEKILEGEGARRKYKRRKASVQNIKNKKLRKKRSSKKSKKQSRKNKRRTKKIIKAKDFLSI